MESSRHYTASSSHHSTAGRGTDGRRRARSGGGSTSPRSKRARPRDRTGPPARSGGEGSRSQIGANPSDTFLVDPQPDRASRNEDDWGDVECIMTPIRPRSSRFLFSGARDHPRPRRGISAGRVRERTWHDSTVLVLDDDDEEEVVIENVTPAAAAGPSHRTRRGRNGRSRRGRTHALPVVENLDTSSEPSPVPSSVTREAGRSDGIGRGVSARTSASARRDPRTRTEASEPRPASQRVVRGPTTTGHRHGPGHHGVGHHSGAAVPPEGGARSLLRSQTQRQIEADERLARLLQRRELGRQRTSRVQDVLDLLDSSSDEEDGNWIDEEDEEEPVLLSGFLHSGSWPRSPGRSRGRRSSSALERLLPFVSLLETLHTPFVGHLNFFDSDDGEEEDDYENLVRLGEALGEVAPRGLSTDQIDLLPTRRVVGSDLASEKRTCHICLEDFRRNNLVRILTCLHEFHKGCLDKWLRRNSTCPLCRKRALE